MALEFFGIRIGRREQRATNKHVVPSAQVVDPNITDATKVNVEDNGGSVHGSHSNQINYDAGIADERDAIARYRDTSLHFEADAAISEIVNEAVVYSEDGKSVELDLSNAKLTEKSAELIHECHTKTMQLLNWDEKGYDYFSSWYIDGRLAFQKIINKADPTDGIIEVVEINPLRIKKICEVIKKIDPDTGIARIEGTSEYYLYDPSAILQSTTNNTDTSTTPNMNGSLSGTSGATKIKLLPDSVAWCPSGLYDRNANIVIGYMHKAVRPINLLRACEDMLAIYRWNRSAEKRMWYIGTGKLSPIKAEEHVRKAMNNYNNKAVYNSKTGQITDDRNFMTMTEDIWLSRGPEGKDTEVTTLAAGTNLGEIEDVLLFRKNVALSLNVPFNRINGDPAERKRGLNGLTNDEINREELKFYLFVKKLRRRFEMLFKDLLKSECVLKGICSLEDWKKIAPLIRYRWETNSYFAELQENSNLRQRIDLLKEVEAYIGKWFDEDYIWKTVLRLTDKEIADRKAAMKKDKEDPESITNNSTGDDNAYRFGRDVQPLRSFGSDTSGLTDDIDNGESGELSTPSEELGGELDVPTQTPTPGSSLIAPSTRTP